MLASLFIAYALTVAASPVLVDIDVTGTFVCKEYPHAQVYLELRERDYPIADDVLTWTFVSLNEPFKIKSNHNELFGITPYLRIAHTCGDVQEELFVEFGKRTAFTSIDLKIIDLQEEGLKDSIRHKYINA